MNESLVSRRRFLQQTSLGATGLALAGGSGRVLAADDSGATRSADSESSQPVRYRPIAASVRGLEKNTILLNGVWRIQPKQGEGARERPLNSASFGSFQVPGQWSQQGYELPQDETACLAREFTVSAK